MEIISIETAVYIAVAAAASVLGVIGFRRLGHHLQQEAEQEIRSLSDRRVRSDLTNFLSKNNVVGDADIRSGVVLAPVPYDQLEPLAIVLGNAASFISRLKNPAASSIYVRDSVNDRFILLADLDLDHLVDAARVMQRVAEETQRSSNDG